MNMLSMTDSKNQTMTTREIAELTGKEHRHVKRDCEVMFKDLKIDAEGCVQNWAYPQNCKVYTEYALDENLTMTLITGYSVKLRSAVIARWKELENQ